MFDDSVFDDFFGGMTEKPLTLHTDGAVVKIKALPAQGRPAGFSGAVGKFDVTSEAPTTTAFDRRSADAENQHHRPRQFRPRHRPRPARERGLEELQAEARHSSPRTAATPRGTKTFEQSIVPVKAGAQEIPAVHFSYFDPESAELRDENDRAHRGANRPKLRSRSRSSPGGDTAAGRRGERRPTYKRRWTRRR